MPRISNLFQIDFGAVRAAIAEANSGLADKHSGVMLKASNVPASLVSADDVRSAQAVRDELKRNISEIRAARLSDRKPLQALVKDVERYFQLMEREAKQSHDDIRRRLTDYMTKALTDESDVIDIGSAVASVTETEKAIILRASPEQDVIVVESEWNLVAVDQDAIDIEALRPYFTSHQLLLAARKHMQDHGPNSLEGATYEKRAV